MTDFEIKIFSAEHVPEAAEIERLCFSEPWSEKSLSYMCSENPFAVAVVDNRTYFVIISPACGKVVGVDTTSGS